MKLRVLLSAILLASVTLVLGPVSSAWACSCLAQTEAELYAAADVVFVGTATTVTKGDPYVYEFDVETVQRGAVGRTTTVSVAQTDVDDCLFEIIADERYQVYAGMSDRLTTGLCTGTHALTAAPAYVPEGSREPALAGTGVPSPAPTLAQPTPVSNDRAGAAEPPVAQVDEVRTAPALPDENDPGSGLNYWWAAVLVAVGGLVGFGASRLRA